MVKKAHGSLPILCILFLMIFPCIALGQTVDSVGVLQPSLQATPMEGVTATVGEMVPNQGFSVNSLWRGFLGMAALILIAFIFSSNRKAINWRTVGIGLSLQLIIAVWVLKVPFVQYLFEMVGQIFVSVLEFTRAGSQFLFEGLVVDMDKFGYIFAF